MVATLRSPIQLFCVIHVCVARVRPLPSQKPRPQPTLPDPATRSRRHKAPRPVFIGAFLAGVITCYGFYVYKSYSLPEGVDLSHTDVSYRYNATASTFDRDVDLTERYTGITKLRRELVQQARGNVLEAAVGTGRNSEFYDLDRIKSLTLLDQSKEMIEVARAKWRETHPNEGVCRLIIRSALDPLPAAPGSIDKPEGQGYDTIIATMSLCSTPLPSLFLRNLATGLSYEETSRAHTASEASGDCDDHVPGRIFLLEHGQSHYSWINKLLDRTAPAHALKHGCWWNRNIGQIAEDSGLEVIKIRRKDFGTTWWLELGLPETAKGKRRQQWLEDTRQDIVKRRAKWEQNQGQTEKELRERDEARRQVEELDKWRRKQRDQMKEKS
ncbi:MAG: hypothetical protein LQ343_003511 [Gyalolechia ehrenbergii]|nr:MAG: hypothetical protein LQ343_003511 [Gyalolechia ehrenbergii]